MAIFDLFSKRERRKQRAGQEDVYQYDDLPEPFRVQVVHIWRDALPIHASGRGPNWWGQIHHVLAREKGVFHLGERRPDTDPFSRCVDYLIKCPTIDAIDLIELSFRVIDNTVRQMPLIERQHYHFADPDEAIAELNVRFKEHGIGYEFIDGEIVRVDSKYLHAEAVRPALHLLRDGGKDFAGPLEEFMRAHDHHRKGEQKDAVADALNAFESTMKAICALRKWPFDANKDTASQLIKVVFDQGLIPPYLQQQFSALRAVLESGVPTVSNRTSRHGQGTTPTNVPDYLAAYVLHLAASNIVLLVEAHNAMP